MTELVDLVSVRIEGSHHANSTSRSFDYALTLLYHPAWLGLLVVSCDTDDDFCGIVSNSKFLPDGDTRVDLFLIQLQQELSKR